jgi:hypothetical protein
LILALSTLLAAAPAQAQSHTFTDLNGQTFPAEVLAVKNGAAVLRRDNDKVYSVDLATLSPADQKFLAGWKAKAGAAQVVTATTDSDIAVKISVEAAKPGEATQLVARVSLINQEECNDFKGLKGTLILIGRQADNANKFKVLAVETFSGDLPACGKFDFNGQPFNRTDAADPNQPSHPYQGYVFVLQNSDGTIIQFYHSGSFVKDGAAALKLRAGMTFTGSNPRDSRRFRLVNYPDSWRGLRNQDF